MDYTLTLSGRLIKKKYDGHMDILFIEGHEEPLCYEIFRNVYSFQYSIFKIIDDMNNIMKFSGKIKSEYHFDYSKSLFDGCLYDACQILKSDDKDLLIELENYVGKDITIEITRDVKSEKEIEEQENDSKFREHFESIYMSKEDRFEIMKTMYEFEDILNLSTEYSQNENLKNIFEKLNRYLRTDEETINFISKEEFLRYISKNNWFYSTFDGSDVEKVVVLDDKIIRLNICLNARNDFAIDLNFFDNKDLEIKIEDIMYVSFNYSKREKGINSFEFGEIDDDIVESNEYKCIDLDKAVDEIINITKGFNFITRDELFSMLEKIKNGQIKEQLDRIALYC